MNTIIRWHKPKWLPKLLEMPMPEPAMQAERILSIQRHIILPAKLVISALVFYYLFYTKWAYVPTSAGDTVYFTDPREVVLETLQGYFIFYIIFNAVAAVLLILRRFPHALVQWVVFCVGLVDGLLVAGLTLEGDPGGFQSNLYWVFPGLIIINALSIPLATPQIVLNMMLSVFYLGAGFTHISIGEPDTEGSRGQPSDQVAGATKFYPADIVKLDTFAMRLQQPANSDGIAKFVRSRLSAASEKRLSEYVGGGDKELQTLLAEDLNQISKAETNSIYDKDRFAGVRLLPATERMLGQNPLGSALRLNRALLLDAFRPDLSKMTAFSALPQNSLSIDTGSESFILRLIILWLMTALFYFVQLLSFRQKLAEEEARKSAAWNDELKAAGRLAAEIAHQLKNPLGIINNAAFTLQRGIKEGRNDFQTQIGIIREEIERSDRIITQLMGYAQLSEGRVEKLNVTEELDRAIAEVFPPGLTHLVQIERSYGPNLPGLLMQKNHFSTVLVNLLQNAREVLNGSGTISVVARTRRDSAIEIIIGDDGPGIPADIKEKIFEAYFTSKEKGTGLGLAIVKHNVELYGGLIRVESELGKGARFIITFPAKAYIETAR